MINLHDVAKKHNNMVNIAMILKNVMKILLIFTMQILKNYFQRFCILPFVDGISYIQNRNS